MSDFTDCPQCKKPFALCTCSPVVENATLHDKDGTPIPIDHNGLLIPANAEMDDTLRTKAVLYVDDAETQALIHAIADEVVKRLKKS